MKALQYDHTGVPRDVLKLRELPLPDPGPGELRLRIAYAPINSSDRGYFNRGEDYTRTLAEADAFLVDLGWIQK